MLVMSEESREQAGQPEVKTHDQGTERPDQQNERGALIALLRLLTREPPPGHDFKTCPVCKKYGVTRI
jgi:hypothetical protein